MFGVPSFYCQAPHRRSLLLIAWCIVISSIVFSQAEGAKHGEAKSDGSLLLGKSHPSAYAFPIAARFA